MTQARYWTDSCLATIDAAAARVRHGRPTLLVVEGEPGMGKSSLLQVLVDRLTDFAPHVASGIEGHVPPYVLLAQWGADVARTASGAYPQPFVAAQTLRALCDDGARTGPVLLLADDVQWADVESLEAVSWLLRRAVGDRILVVVAHRPFGRGQHTGWQRWTDTTEAVLRIGLSGLSQAHTAALIRAHAGNMSALDVDRLWVHTAGNPLYLTSLLREHSADDLWAMRALPAPAQYADDISAALARRPLDAIRLAGAMAVLGSGRIGRFEAATVAGMPDREVADGAILELVDAGLVAVEEVGAAPSLRWAHALTAAAVYQQLEPSLRRELHGRASTVVTSESVRFEHRMRAVVGVDDELADDLERAAGEHHRQRGYRVAAQYLRWAQVVTADVEVRHRRRLDGCFEALLARELTTVRDELPSIIDARHDERRTLVVGALHCFEGNYHDGVQVLSAIATWPPDTGDALTRHRIEMLLAWARTLLGHDVDLIAAGLERAAALHATDPAMTAYGLLARGHVAGRTQGWDQFLALIDQLPEAASATPPQLSGLLVWRGQDYLSRGLFAEAASDLREVQHRQHDGVVDALSNGFDSMLAAAYWFAGRWQLASVTFRGAREAPAELVGLLTSALSPMAPSAAGDFAEADRLIAEGAAVLEQRPWPEAVEVHLAALVVRRHAGGVREAQAGLMAEFRTRWPHTPIGAGFVSGVWAVHLALAQLWAGELQAAEVQLDRAAGVADPGASLHAMERWVRGLLHEARGRSEEALQHLRTATAVGGTQGPLYRAHALADRARIARALGSGSEAASSLSEALALYQELGAAPYIERLTQQADQAAVPVAPSSVESYVVTLTEREHDVLALVVEGYSYAQIARQLYISQSTVSYHLGNIYPKAGVRSRHELTQWVRAHPGSVRTSAKG